MEDAVSDNGRQASCKHDAIEPEEQLAAADTVDCNSVKLFQSKFQSLLKDRIAGGLLD